MRILSGIQPTGTLHIGNYLGSVKQWSDMLNDSPEIEAFLMVVDLHAITVPQDPAVLRRKIYELLAIYLAAGFNPEKDNIFVQSQNPDHPYLGWIFNCITPFGWMERMTQYKDKKQKMEEYQNIVSVGLFDYPALMAADILLYDPDMVPVGADQKQHVELTRDIAERFNNIYGETFKVPEFRTNKETTNILDLQNPDKKMSKSDASAAGRIDLMDTPQGIQDKLKRAVTDSDNHVAYDPEKKPGVSNLLAIFSSATGKTVEELAQAYDGKGYGQFKSDIADAVVAFLSPLQEKINTYLSDLEQLDRIVNNGNERARELSSQKIALVADKMGLYHDGKKI
ncbi:MAG: tryptophan--tRNA ligase [Candidatus Dojkabacteria bacterium]|nr:MAG: tryptophan--tRNA ligase [Candidatus Dojkabacteria bacterium]